MKSLLAFAFILTACPSRAATKTYSVPASFDPVQFISSASAQGIDFAAKFDSDTPNGYVWYYNGTLTVTLYEKSTAPTFTGRHWHAGNKAVPGLASAWNTVASILGL